MVVYGAWGRGNRVVLFNVYKLSVGEDEKSSVDRLVMMVAKQCKCTNAAEL